MNTASRRRAQKWVAAFGAAALIGISAGAAQSGLDVGFVSSVRGKPQLRNTSGKTTNITLMRPLSPGSTIVLGVNESFGFCHESAARTYRVEGEGEVRIGDLGINTEPGGPKVIVSGVCNSASTPSETGGILSRGFKPPSSPK